MEVSELKRLEAQVADITKQIEVLKGKIVKEFAREKTNLCKLAAIFSVEVIEVVDILIEAQRVSDIGIIEWIEENVPAKSLFKVVEFFFYNPEASTEEACNTLGVSRILAKFGKLYSERKYDQ